VRLAGGLDGHRVRAVLFGPGDHRTPTEARVPPPPVAPGERLDLGGGLGAVVEAVAPLSPRLVTLRFELGGDALLAALYARGRPSSTATSPSRSSSGTCRPPTRRGPGRWWRRRRGCRSTWRPCSP
jgi:S-adenosylmethionine:tRNA ribosyltransferase-isomerase